MSSTEAAGPAASTPPDWSTLQIELHCPRCGYNLRMLTGSRCPECGLELDWNRIIASAENRITSPLFEYKWRDRPVRSYFRTVALSMRPSRLWGDLSIMDEPRPVPLAVFGFITVLIYAAVPLATVMCHFLWMMRKRPWTPRVFTLFESVTVNSARFAGTGVLVHCLIALTIWFYLQLFRQTISRYNLRQGQILRIICLACAPLFIVKTIEQLVAGWWTIGFGFLTVEWSLPFDLAALFLTARSVYLEPIPKPFRVSGV